MIAEVTVSIVTTSDHSSKRQLMAFDINYFGKGTGVQDEIYNISSNSRTSRSTIHRPRDALIIVTHLYLSDVVLPDTDVRIRADTAQSLVPIASLDRTPPVPTVMHCRFRAMCHARADEILAFDVEWLNFVINDAYSKRGEMPWDL